MVVNDTLFNLSSDDITVEDRAFFGPAGLGGPDNAMKQSEDAIRSRVLAAVERLEASGVVAGPPVMRAARRKKNV